MQEKQWLLLLSEGCESAFNHFYQKYAKMLIYYSSKFIKSDAIVEEVVHDVFMKVWQKRRKLKNVKNFKAYLFKICRNHIINVLEKVLREDTFKTDILLKSSQNLEDEIIGKDIGKFTDKIIEQLPPQRKKIFQLCRLEGRSYEEVAELLGITKSTVSDHLVKATKTIKQYLARIEKSTV